MTDGLDLVEEWQLEERVSELQKLITDMEGTHASGSMLQAAISNAQKRIESIETGEGQGKSEKERREAARAQTLVMGYLVMKEAALTEAERFQFAEFLEQDHFTRSDFDALERFYGDAWKRLSDRGKAEMSHRVWEGVRVGEYEFSELPQVVRQREMEYLFGLLKNESKTPENLKAIPEEVQKEFIAAMESQDFDRAEEIVSSGAFVDVVSKSPKESETKLEKPKQAAILNPEQADGRRTAIELNHNTSTGFEKLSVEI